MSVVTGFRGSADMILSGAPRRTRTQRFQEFMGYAYFLTGVLFSTLPGLTSSLSCVLQLSLPMETDYEERWFRLTGWGVMAIGSAFVATGRTEFEPFIYSSGIFRVFITPTLACGLSYFQGTIPWSLSIVFSAIDLLSGVVALIGWSKEKPSLQPPLETATMPWYQVLISSHLPSFPGRRVLRSWGLFTFFLWLTLAIIPGTLLGLEVGQHLQSAAETGYFQSFCFTRAIRGEMIVVRSRIMPMVYVDLPFRIMTLFVLLALGLDSHRILWFPAALDVAWIVVHAAILYEAGNEESTNHTYKKVGIEGISPSSST